MNAVHVKPGCRFELLTPGGIRILAALDTIARAAAIDLTITCGTEAHAAGDVHTLGLAFDVSVAGFTPDQVIDLRRRLQLELGEYFTVLYERPDHPTDARLAAIAYVNAHATAPHFHVQVKLGATYPPAIPSTPAIAV